MTANVTPRRSGRRSASPVSFSPEKSQQHTASRSSDIHEVPKNASNIMGWESTDAKPLPEEGVLRDFDLDLKYGPCCTISRKDRWQRAKALGLNPPAEILALIEKTSNNQSVLDVHLSQISTTGNFR